MLVEEEQLETVKDDDSARANDLPVPSRRGLMTVIGVVCLLLIVLLAVGIIPRLRRKSELSAVAAERNDETAAVNIITPRRAAASTDIVLPGNVEAEQETVIYARTSGYVRRWLVDIGDRVAANQTLAEIDAPEVDQQLAQAREEFASAEGQLQQARADLERLRANLEQGRAALGQTRTNMELSRVTLKRSQTLLTEGVVPQQETDERRAEYDVRSADVAAAQAAINARQADINAGQSTIGARRATVQALAANVKRLSELQSFKHITAPYAGVITARNIDTGSLISAGTAAANSNPLFRLARVDALRIKVNVPQTYVASIHRGLSAEVSVRELPQQTFRGNVYRTTNALDPASRTLLAEVQLPNDKGQLLPGMYAEVKLAAGRAVAPLLIPASALVVGREGVRVAVVSPDEAIIFHKVDVGRDYGAEVEVVSGLGDDESLVTNPTDALQEGQRVKAIGQKQ